MFVEIDKDLFINLDLVFAIHYKSLHNKGQWEFISSTIEQRDHTLTDRSNRRLYSKKFTSKEEADRWLKKILTS